jgi:anti-anti-sigma factor
LIVIDLISEKVDGIPVVRISGRIDMDTAKHLEEACNGWINQGERFLILDLTNVRYISSWGLRCILGVGKTLGQRGGQLLTCGLNATVKEVFQISGFDSAFPTYPTIEGALAAIQR